MSSSEDDVPLARANGRANGKLILRHDLPYWMHTLGFHSQFEDASAFESLYLIKLP